MGTRGKVPILFCALSLFLCPASRGQVQQLRFDHLSADDGLPDRGVYSIYQDHLGYLWIGTGNGLVRYDGYELEVFESDADDPGAVGSGRIESMVEDEGGDLWISTSRGGLSRFDRTTGRFLRFVHVPGDPNTLSSNRITRIIRDRVGRLWVLTPGAGLNLVDPQTESIERYLHDPGDPVSLSGDDVTDLVVDGQGRIWVATTTGLNRFDEQSRGFIRYRHDPEDDDSLIDDRIRVLTVDQRGILWIGTKGGLDRFDPGADSFTHYVHSDAEASSLDDDAVHALHVDRDGVVWVGTGNGLNRFDAVTGSFSHFTPQSSSTTSAGARTVRIYEDRTGLLWVVAAGRSTESQDLYTLDPETGVFAHLREDPDDPTSITIRGRVQAITEDRTGTMWIGASDGGLNKLDRSRLRFTYDPYPNGVGHSSSVRAIYEDSQRRLWLATGVLDPDPRDVGLRLIDPATDTFTDYRLGSETRRHTNRNFVEGIHEDHDGRFWLLTAQGLRRFYPATGEGDLYVPYSNPENKDDNRVLTLYEDVAGLFWLGTYSGGLVRFDPDARTFVRRYRHDLDDPDSIPFARVNDIQPDGEGGLWLATYGGLVRFNPARKRFKVIRDRGVGRFNARMIHEDRRGNLWLATWPRGLVRYDRETNSFTSYTRYGELFNASAFAILEDEMGNLWISSNRGLSQFNPRLGVFRNYAADEGIGGDVFNPGVAFRGRDGKLYLGGRHGMTSFYPRGERGSANPPGVVITGLRLFNQPVTPSADGPLRVHISEAESIRLTDDRNDVTFEYVALHFSRPNENQYAYRLEGYEKEWRYVGAQRAAVYPDLPAGEYTFHVKAANADGVWNEQGASIRLVVVSSWMQRSLVYGLAAFGLIMLVFGAYQFRVRRLRTKTRRLEQDIDAQIWDPEAQTAGGFQAPLLPDLDLVGVRAVQKRTLHSPSIAKHLPDVSSLLPESMQLDRQAGDLVAFLGEVVRSFSPLAERRRITLRFRPETEFQPLLFDHDVLGEVVSNLLSNALKSTPEDGGIWVTTTSDGEAIEIVVKDTGPGIPPEKREHIFDRFYQVSSSLPEYDDTGLGLRLAHELVELHVGTLDVRSEMGVGSAFIVRLPLELPERSLETSIGDGAPADHRAVNVDMGQGFEEEETEPATGDGPRTVLIVDDNRDVRTLLRNALEGTYTVFESTNGVEGLEAARKYRPDLVLTDVPMLHMDGIALCRAIRADDRLQETRVIMLTTKAALAHRILGPEAGADDFLIKPFSGPDVQVCVTNMMLSREDHLRNDIRASADVVATRADEQFLKDVVRVLESHLGDRKFSDDVLADELGISRRRVNRRVKSMTGETPEALLLRMRLERAKRILEAHPDASAEVARVVGFRSSKRFYKAFRKVFGALPGD